MSNAETYLANRNWKVASTSNLREAIAFLIKNQPEFLLISVDHPHKKAKVLSQAFQCRIIPFAEKTSPSSTKALMDLNSKYYLYPPVSGPAIQRLILKIKRDDELGENDTDSSKFGLGANADSNSTVTISGGQQDETQANQGRFDAARAMLSQLAGEDDHGDKDSGIQHTGGSSNKESSSGVAYWGDAAGGNSPGQTNSDSAHTQASADSASSQPSGLHPNFMQHGNSNAGAHTQMQEQAPGESFAEYAERMRKMAEANMQQSGSANPEHSGLASGNKDSALNSAESGATGSARANSFYNNENSEPHDPFSGLESKEGKKQAPVMESDYVGRKTKTGKNIQSDWSQSSDPNQPIIVRGTELALNETVVVKDNLKNQNIKTIDKASNVACITVDSPKFKGYLVCALGRNRKIDKDFVDTIKKRLSSFLKANGEQISDKDTMELKIEEVEFEDWALNQAEFLKKSIHDEDEIAIAFFPNQDLEINLEDSASEKMLQMDLKEIKEDTKLEFDLYIYMPENQRYLLYTPQGMTFYTNQKGRLHEKGVTHMHLRKESAGHVKKYRAQNFLNERIAQFKSLKNAKKATV